MLRHRASFRHLLAASGLVATTLTAMTVAVHAEAASQWTEAYNSRVRLIAGAQAGKPLAGIEIELSAGWKTYWRAPGDSGGVPPSFDWGKSQNLQSAVVLYPAPHRMTDPAGDAVGYTERVVFPVRLVAADAAKPVRLALQLEYGICNDICVPVEASLALDLPASLAAPVPDELAQALAWVPRSEATRRALDPKLLRTAARLQGDAPRLEIDAEFPGGAEGADAFIEAPDGIYVPQPVALGEGKGERRSFVVDLRTGVDPAELKGKRMTVTLVGEKGTSEVHWQLD